MSSKTRVLYRRKRTYSRPEAPQERQAPPATEQPAPGARPQSRPPPPGTDTLSAGSIDLPGEASELPGEASELPGKASELPGEAAAPEKIIGKLRAVSDQVPERPMLLAMGNAALKRLEPDHARDRPSAAAPARLESGDKGGAAEPGPLLRGLLKTHGPMTREALAAFISGRLSDEELARALHDERQQGYIRRDAGGHYHWVADAPIIIRSAHEARERTTMEAQQATEILRRATGHKYGVRPRAMRLLAQSGERRSIDEILAAIGGDFDRKKAAQILYTAGYEGTLSRDESGKPIKYYVAEDKRAPYLQRTAYLEPVLQAEAVLASAATPSSSEAGPPAVALAAASADHPPPGAGAAAMPAAAAPDDAAALRAELHRVRGELEALQAAPSAGGGPLPAAAGDQPPLIVEVVFRRGEQEMRMSLDEATAVLRMFRTLNE